ncbi:MAG: DUF512 domain-containing protein, partial [Chloroflexi bacterium]|nr:DUF512 domain-containing protein [Chloroflexota bacterium]
MPESPISNLQLPITNYHPGIIQSIEPHSLAAEMGLQIGDEVISVNGNAVDDVIDVQFYAADDQVEITYRRNRNRQSAIRNRQSAQFLGITFTHPTFDIDIRRCNNLCPFCFVLQTAPRMRRALYIKDDDYRYSFLYGHYVTLTNLSEHDWWRIENQGLTPLYVSVHATDLEVRRKCLANKTAPDILEQLKWLRQRGITCHTQLVITPGLNGGKVLDQSLRDLAKFHSTVLSVSVVPVGLTKHHKYGHRPNTVEECEKVLGQVDRWQEKFLKRFGARFVYGTDEWYLVTKRSVPSKKELDGHSLEENGLGMVRNFLNKWRGEKKEIKGKKGNRGTKGTLATGTLFAGTLKKITDEFNTLARTNLTVAPILNERLGHTITVSGLMMGADVIAQLKDRD